LVLVKDDTGSISHGLLVLMLRIHQHSQELLPERTFTKQPACAELGLAETSSITGVIYVCLGLMDSNSVSISQAAYASYVQSAVQNECSLFPKNCSRDVHEAEQAALHRHVQPLGRSRQSTQNSSPCLANTGLLLAPYYEHKRPLGLLAWLIERVASVRKADEFSTL
jgi:hypothetical protein